MRLDAIQRVHDPQRLLDLSRLPPPHPNKLVLGLARERKVVDHVAEIVTRVALQVGDELLRVFLVRLEGTAGREVAVCVAQAGLLVSSLPSRRRRKGKPIRPAGSRDAQIANDLVDANLARNVAPLGRLLLDLVAPSLRDALRRSILR
jgi:hypothetical protein